MAKPQTINLNLLGGGERMKKVIFYLIVAVFASLFADTVYAQNGWVEKDGFTYYYKGDGTKATGFQTIDGEDYYFYSTGGMAAGWLNLPGDRTFYLNEEDGTMAKGFNIIDGEKHYFYSTGGMHKGWLNLPGDRNFYFHEDGDAATGFNTIDGEKYYFYSTGGLVKGWLNLPGDRKFYFQEDGSAATGFNTVDGKDFYFYSTGGVAKSGWLDLPGARKFYINNDGTVRGYQTETSQNSISIDELFNFRQADYLTESERLDAHNYTMNTRDGWYYVEQLNREFDKYIQGSFSWDYRNKNNRSNYLAFRRTGYWYENESRTTDAIYDIIHQRIKDHQLIITPSFEYEKQDIFEHPTIGGTVVSQKLKLRYASADGSRIKGWEPNTWYTVHYFVRFGFSSEKPSWDLWNYGDYGWLSAGFEYQTTNWQ